MFVLSKQTIDGTMICVLDQSKSRGIFRLFHLAVPFGCSQYFDGSQIITKKHYRNKNFESSRDVSHRYRFHNDCGDAAHVTDRYNTYSREYDKTKFFFHKYRSTEF